MQFSLYFTALNTVGKVLVGRNQLKKERVNNKKSIKKVTLREVVITNFAFSVKIVTRESGERKISLTLNRFTPM